MENSTSINFKERLKRLITYQDILARNNLLAQRTCDHGLLKYLKLFNNNLSHLLSFEIEFSAFLTIHNELRRKYVDLRAYVDEQYRYVEQYRIESARKDKKIQSQR